MVWTKWYGQNGSLYGQNATGQNGIDKIINQLTNPAPTGNMMFSSLPLPL